MRASTIEQKGGSTRFWANFRLGCPLGFVRAVGLLLCGYISFAGSTASAQSTVCASCQLQIHQKLTLERQAFNATMTITNGLSSSMSDLSVQIYFTDAKGNPIESTTDATHTGAVFFYELANGQAAPASIDAGQTGTLGWLIIPSASAGGNSPSGVQYYVGATLTYSAGGKQHSVKVVPDYIYVQPEPLLTLDYFVPDQVYGADPMLAAAMPPIITPPVPFNLGVRVKNTGFGTANNLAINSGQPVITNNPQHLAVQFLLLGASVNDALVQPSLLASFGTVGAQQSSVARWVMTSSLSGQMTITNISMTHASSLGGAVTSLISAAPVGHALVQDILVDLPGRDGVRDFLANDGTSGNPVYKVYESQGGDTGVTDESTSANFQAQSGLVYQMTLPSSAGFIYAKKPDPFNGRQAILSVVRADGKQLNGNNAWLSKTFDKNSNTWNYFFNLFDDNNLTGQAYVVTFGASSGSGLSKLAAWKQAYWPGVTDPNIIGGQANPTRDGLPNLLKYALNLDPTKGEANSGILIGKIVSGGQTYLTLTYMVRVDDPNLQYTVIGSNSPTGTNSPWTAQTQTIPISQAGVPTNMQRFEVQDSQPIEGGSPQRFLKLQVINLGN